MNGTYSEKLPHFPKGTLIIENKNWTIRFYFPGPDLRYNGTFFNIEGTEVDRYINAYKENWKRYIKLKCEIPNSGSFTTIGLSGMVIRVGGEFREGICLTKYELPIDTVEKLNNMISDLEWAKMRSNEILEMNTYTNISSRNRKVQLTEREELIYRLIMMLRSYAKEQKENPQNREGQNKNEIAELKSEISILKKQIQLLINGKE